MNTTYIIRVSSACMPTSCWGRYSRVAVLQVECSPDGVPTHEPTMISERARGVVSIEQVWEPLHVGTTERCAHARAMTEARELATGLLGDGLDALEYGSAKLLW